MNQQQGALRSWRYCNKEAQTAPQSAYKATGVIAMKSILTGHPEERSDEGSVETDSHPLRSHFATLVHYGNGRNDWQPIFSFIVVP